MSESKYSSLSTKHISEGRSEEVLHDRAVYSQGHRSVSTFVKMVVLEVINDPTTVDHVKLAHYEHDLKVSNIAYATVAPRNSIIARPVMNFGSGASDKVMVLYPFFPSHISFPAKPGEHVWVVFEQPDAKISEIGYWMCRVVGPEFVEDVNYTHMDRQFDASFLPRISDKFKGTDNPIYEFRNGAVNTSNGERWTVSETSSLPGDENAYKKLLTNTDASKIIKYEAVPRYRKRPADVVLEGSNNTLIVLGTDRTTSYADTSTTDPNTGIIPKPVSKDVNDTGAGSIDLVVGRGQTSDTSGKSENNKILGKELGKSKKDLSPKEGDVDLLQDRSRILIAQKTNADVNFGIDSYLKTLTGGQGSSDSVKTSGAIIAKSDRIRIIGRSDIALITTSQGSLNENGFLQDNSDTKKWAGVVVRSNGDVYIQPVNDNSFDVETKKCSFKINPENLDFKVNGTKIKADKDLVAITALTTTMSDEVDMGRSPVTISLYPQTKTTLSDICTALAQIATAMQGAVGNLGIPIPTLVAAAPALMQLITQIQSIDIPSIESKTTKAT